MVTELAAPLSMATSKDKASRPSKVRTSFTSPINRLALSPSIFCEITTCHLWAHILVSVAHLLNHNWRILWEEYEVDKLRQQQETYINVDYVFVPILPHLFAVSCEKEDLGMTYILRKL